MDNRIRAAHPEVTFIAETLGCSPEQTRDTAAAGFDWIFNSAKWWDYTSPWLMEQHELTRNIAPSIGFPESHDTQRLFAETDGNLEAQKQRYLFTALFSAGVMIPVGYEFGFGGGWTWSAPAPVTGRTQASISPTTSAW